MSLTLTAPELAVYCRQLREAAGLTPSELARRLSVDRRRVAAAEDESLPSETAIRVRIIAELAGATVERVYRVT
jgi:DNA-binding XRE family transcriptional regulator